MHYDFPELRKTWKHAEGEHVKIFIKHCSRGLVKISFLGIPSLFSVTEWDVELNSKSPFILKAGATDFTENATHPKPTVHWPKMFLYLLGCWSWSPGLSHPGDTRRPPAVWPAPAQTGSGSAPAAIARSDPTWSPTCGRPAARRSRRVREDQIFVHSPILIRIGWSRFHAFAVELQQTQVNNHTFSPSLSPSDLKTKPSE